MTTERITIRLPIEVLTRLDSKLMPWQTRADYIKEALCRIAYDVEPDALAKGGKAKSGKPYIVGERPPEQFAPIDPSTYEEYLAIREGIAGLDYWAEYESRYDSREAFLIALTKAPPFMDTLAEYRQK